MTAVETHGLVRSYAARTAKPTGVITALDGIDIVVERGEVRGLLGPNGAGKTTLCKILSTVLLPTAGTARVLGHDVVSQASAVKRSVGVVFGGDRGLYGRLTARQNLRFWAALYRLHGAELRIRADQLLERVGLLGRADDRVDKFSRGMKQRLHLARGLIADPPVLILDEPTAGLDPVAIREFRALIKELRADARTILLTTHDMNEAEAVCDRVTLIDHGALLLTEAPDRVGHLVSRCVRVEAAGVPEDVREHIAVIPGVVSVARTAKDRCGIEAESGAVREVLAQLLAAGVTELATRSPSLEEVYLELVGGRGMSVRR